MDEKTFPQADDFEKIISLLNINREEDLSNNNKISALLGSITDRQVSYYVSAAEFLGLVKKENGKRNFTEKGKNLRKMNSYMQEVELASTILESPVFAKVYSLEKIVGHQDCYDISKVIKEKYPNYSEAIYKRRAQTVMSWLQWVESKFNDE